MGLLLRGQKSRADSHLACRNAPPGVLNLRRAVWLPEAILLWGILKPAHRGSAGRGLETLGKGYFREGLLASPQSLQHSAAPAPASISLLLHQGAKPDPLSPTLPKFLTHSKQERITIFFFLMCSPSRSHLPPPSPPDPSRSSQCTRSECLSHASNLGWWSVSP